MQKRSAGVLLHISSLPSPYGIGDLGPTAHAFAATLAAAGIKYWQFLPLTPTSQFIGNSPYSSPSAFAGNPLFISPELLCAANYLSYADVECTVPEVPAGTVLGQVDYAGAADSRRATLNAAFLRHLPRLEGDAAFQSFCHAHAYWLEDYALFSAIKEDQGGRSWVDWPEALKRRVPEALAEWAGGHERQVLLHKFIQFIFFSQWASLRERCKEYGLRLIGDLPIYVTHDSADVWANPELFNLDEAAQPITVAGVPPDYFSETGQRWGNPVYNWDVMERDGFAWWKKRLAHNLLMSDLVRLDHFRGFCGYWEVPAHEETAVRGTWAVGPGKKFFSALHEEFSGKFAGNFSEEFGGNFSEEFGGNFSQEFGGKCANERAGEFTGKTGNKFVKGLPIIAEDLGVITDDVREVMRDFELPGMKVLQFGFGGNTAWNNPDAPFRHPAHSVVYTGTHDNTTTRAWYESASAEERNNFCNYVGRELANHEAAEAMIRLALESASEIAIIPMQDILNLGAEGRMNTPSVARGNWGWRLDNMTGWVKEESNFAIGHLPMHNLPLPEIFARFYFLCRIYGRVQG